MIRAEAGPVSGPGVLLERDAELHALASALDRATTGDGRAVLIQGRAGAGKTRLVDEVHARAQAAGMQVFAARGGELEREFTWSVVRGLFERTGTVPAGSGRPFDGVAAHARTLLTGDPAGQARVPVDAALHSLYWLVANLADEQPLLLTIDDAHWADAASLGFLNYLARRLDGMRVAIVVATRPEALRDATLGELVLEPRCTIIRPASLSEDAVATLVRTRLGRDADTTFWRACHAATQGNPFLVSALLEALAAEGVAPVAAAVDQVGAVSLDSVVPWMLSRLRALRSGAAALARAVAVLGDGAALEHAAALAGLDVEEASASADDLVGAGFLDPRHPLCFVHPLVRSAVFDALAPGERAQLHAHAARILTAAGAASDHIAAHLLGAPPAADAGRAAQLRDAARDAMVRGDPGAACRYLERALAEPPPAQQRGDVLHELGCAESAALRPAATRRLSEAVALGATPGIRAQRMVSLADAQVWAGAGREALLALERAIGDLGSSDAALSARLEATLMTIASTEPEFLPLARERAAGIRADDLGSDAASRMLLALMAWVRALSGGPADLVADHVERAHHGGRLMSEHPPASLVVVFSIAALNATDRFERAFGLWTEVLRRAGRAGSVSGFATASLFRAGVARRLGRLMEAEADARAAFELAGAGAVAVTRTAAAAFLASVLIERDQLDAAAVVLGETAASDSDHPVEAELVYTRGLLAAARGDHLAALEHHLEAARIIGPLTDTPAFLPWRSRAALSCAAVGDLDAARRLADEELMHARRLGSQATIGVALHARGVVATGAQSLELLAAATEALGQTAARLDQARALVDHGAALRRAGRRRDAREQLGLALDLATRCGAPRVCERAREELAAAGGRPRSPYVTGPEALTPSELRIARLAASGDTNREIAQALFVIPKTVEMHLSNVYRKLGIASRRELATALATTTQPPA